MVSSYLHSFPSSRREVAKGVTEATVTGSILWTFNFPNWITLTSFLHKVCMVSSNSQQGRQTQAWISPLLCNLTQSQIFAVRTETSLGSRCSVGSRGYGTRQAASSWPQRQGRDRDQLRADSLAPRSRGGTTTTPPDHLLLGFLLGVGATVGTTAECTFQPV